MSEEQFNPLIKECFGSNAELRDFINYLRFRFYMELRGDELEAYKMSPFDEYAEDFYKRLYNIIEHIRLIKFKKEGNLHYFKTMSGVQYMLDEMEV